MSQGLGGDGDGVEDVSERIEARLREVVPEVTELFLTARRELRRESARRV